MFTLADLLNSWLLLLRLRLISRISFKLWKPKKINKNKTKKTTQKNMFFRKNGAWFAFKNNLQNCYHPIRSQNIIFGLKVCNINFTNCFISTTMFLYLSHLDGGETFFSTKIHLESLTTWHNAKIQHSFVSLTNVHNIRQ